MRMLVYKPAGQISVKELCGKARLSRTAFYDCYKNIDDLVSEIEDDLVGGLLEVIPDKAGGLGAWCMEPSAMAFISSHKGILRSFLGKNENLRFINKWRTGIKAGIADAFPPGEGQRLLLEVASVFIVTAYTMWLECGEEAYDVNAAREKLDKLAGIL